MVETVEAVGAELESGLGEFEGLEEEEERTGEAE